MKTLLIKALRNLAGVALMLLGFIWLFTPGQGLLTLAAGFALLEFPGKPAVTERILLCSGAVARVVPLPRKQKLIAAFERSSFGKRAREFLQRRARERFQDGQS